MRAGRRPPAAPSRTSSVPGYNFDIVSGVEYDLDISRPVGQRVTRTAARRHRPVRDGDSFTMALNNYRQSGGGGYDMLAGAEVVYDSNDDVRELLIDEVRRRGTIRATDYFTQNWRLAAGSGGRGGAGREQTAREAPAAADLPAGAHVAPQPVADAAAHAAARADARTTSTAASSRHDAVPGQMEGRPVGGAAALATYFELLEREGFNGPTILLHGGDVMQGTPVSNLTRGRATIDFYNHIGWHAGALGNHEFDWGLDVLRDRIAQSDFPWLAANIMLPAATPRPAGSVTPPPSCGRRPRRRHRPHHGGDRLQDHGRVRGRPGLRRWHCGHDRPLGTGVLRRTGADFVDCRGPRGRYVRRRT
jgi:2',3'-cyclic-nucleotide 2'-phosphodiesterase / 3'-nucleotidase / 5'-nucleotidase